MTPKEAYDKAWFFGPSDETRFIACQSARYAYLYALNVDKGPRPDTREAASRIPHWKTKYEAYFSVKRS